MSAEPEYTPDPDALSRIQAEDPEFAVVLARARAKARGEPYDRARHGPFDPELPPRQKRKKEQAMENVGEMLDDLLDRFKARGGPVRPHLRVIPGGERENVKRVRDL